MNKLKFAWLALPLASLLTLVACGGEPAQDASADKSNTELYDAVNEPLEKAREVEGMLEKAAQERNEALDE